MRPFFKGIQLPDFEASTLLTTQIFAPKSPPFVTLHVQAGSKILVCQGDVVCVGSRLTDPNDFFSVPIHASTSGKVVRVSNGEIQIESDVLDRLDPSIHPRLLIPTAPDEILDLIREAGVIDLGGSGASTYQALLTARTNEPKILVIDCCQLEPFVTADDMLILNFAAEILKGVELLRVACGAARAVIAVSKAKSEMREILNSKNYNLKFSSIETVIVSNRYPQNQKEILAETITGKILKWGELASSAGVHVENLATVFACYEAVYLNKPLFERVVTVGGPCIADPKNLWVRAGVSAKYLFNLCKGFLRDPERVVLGGPVMGRAIQDLETAMPLEAQALLALPKEIVNSHAEEPCIRCGHCVDACPEALLPETLVRAVRKANTEQALEFGIHGCTECNACVYVCPSHIPIVQVIREGKQKFQNTYAETQGVSIEEKVAEVV